MYQSLIPIIFLSLKYGQSLMRLAEKFMEIFYAFRISINT